MIVFVRFLSWVEVGETDCIKFRKSPIRNRVLETRFPGGIHITYKLPRHTQLEIESLRLDFQMDAKWQERHIKSDPNMKTKSLRLGLQAQNRVS